MKIALLGDIGLFGRNTVATHGWENRFEALMPVLHDCDFVIGNLETPLTYSNRTIGGKSAYIKGIPVDVAILKYLKITHVTLANNHIFDYCTKGLDDTVRVLEDNGIRWYGVKDHQEKILCGGDAVSLLGYCCYSTNAKGMGIVNVLNPLKMESDLEKIKDSLPIVSVHWGQEHVHYPDRDHVDMVRKLCKDRTVIFHGHHPHVIQGLERVGTSLVAYSLGNFCFDDVYTNKAKEPLVRLSAANQESYVLILNIVGSQLRNCEVIPFQFSSGKYTLDKSILEKMQEWSDSLNMDKEEYNQQRNNDLYEYINSRKAMRNFTWYLKRFNINSVKMILSSRRNEKEYSKLIKGYIL